MYAATYFSDVFTISSYGLKNSSPARKVRRTTIDLTAVSHVTYCSTVTFVSLNAVISLDVAFCIVSLYCRMRSIIATYAEPVCGSTQIRCRLREPFSDRTAAVPLLVRHLMASVASAPCRVHACVLTWTSTLYP